jgi:hypothetical protein
LSGDSSFSSFSSVSTSNQLLQDEEMV